MPCASPPELNDGELLAHIDGEADRQVEAHLERCAYCRERARRLARLQDRLTAQLYRITCPSPEELGEYHLGILPHDRAAGMARHLAECPHCAREVAQLRGYLARMAPTLELGPLEGVREQVQVLVARLVSGRPGDSPLKRPTLAPAYAGVRGEEEGPYIYQAGDVQIAIGVQDDAERPGRKVIFGLVTGMDTSEAQVNLREAGQSISVVPVDELGNFALPNLAPDTYDLTLSGPGVEIHVPELQVGTR